jgi:hypothetical protein
VAESLLLFVGGMLLAAVPAGLGFVAGVLWARTYRR